MSRKQTMLYGIVGEQLTEVTRDVPIDEPPPLPENAKLSAIGKSVPRFDAVQKVTGQARYTFDIQLPGMLHARRVVSTVPHARVKSIDTSAAERYPGVRAVHVLERIFLTAQLRDPKAEAGNRYPMVRYTGQPLAGIAAETPQAAEAAVRLVKVEYELLPHVTTLEEAMRENAPQVFPGPTEQRGTAHDHARCTKAALQCIMGDKRLLDRMELITLRQTFDRRNPPVAHIERECHAARRDLAVHPHGAGGARPAIASDLGAGQAEAVTKDLGQRGGGIDVDRRGAAVHPKREGNGVGPDRRLCIWPGLVRRMSI